MPARQRHGNGGDRRSKKRLNAKPLRRFLFGLALALGKTVGELERTLLADELVEWIAFQSIEPFGSVMDNFRAGLPAAVLANQHRPKDAEVVNPLDFFGGKKEKPQETPEQIAANIRRRVFGIK